VYARYFPDGYRLVRKANSRTFRRQRILSVHRGAGGQFVDEFDNGRRQKRWLNKYVSGEHGRRFLFCVTPAQTRESRRVFEQRAAISRDFVSSDVAVS